MELIPVNGTTPNYSLTESQVIAYNAWATLMNKAIDDDSNFKTHKEHSFDRVRGLHLETTYGRVCEVLSPKGEEVFKSLNNIKWYQK